MMPKMQALARSADQNAAPPPTFVRVTRTVALTCLLGLIALGLLWELWWAPTGHRALALKVLPLTIPLAGILKNRLYTYRWLSLLVWLYVAEGAVRSTSGEAASRPLALIETVFGLLLFAACAAHVRWRLAHKDPGPGN